VRKTVEIYEHILKANDFVAQENRETFSQKGVLTIGLLSSPGAGKTSLLERTAERLRGEGFRMAALVGDLATTWDAERLQAQHVPVVQLTTGGACHLEAQLVRRALKSLHLDQLDFLFIENVGNLVCPAAYDLGEHYRAVLLSVPEGDDKPGKYPSAFRKSQLFIITKIDLLPFMDFDPQKAIEDARRINPDLRTFSLSNKTGEGLDEWISFLTDAYRTFRQQPASSAGR